MHIKPKFGIQIKLSMALLELNNHESFLIHGIALKGQFPYVTYCFIRCRLLILLHPIAFEHLCIPGWSCSNHNYKVLITLHLGLHIERDGPHTPCNHANKLKNVAKG